MLFGYAYAQPYYFSHYQVEQGLSNNSVLCSIQDRLGFMWFGTKDGLNRFDGYSFKTFHNDPDDPNGLGSNMVRALFEDQEGIIWVGTDQGIFLFDPRSETFSLFHPDVTKEILDIKGDASGNIWFINGLALYRYAQHRDVLTTVTLSNELEVSALCTTENGETWIGTISGDLIRCPLDGKPTTTPSLFANSPRTVSRRIERIYCDSTGRLMVGTAKQGVKLFDPQRQTYIDLVTQDGNGMDIFVRDIMEKGNGEYWFATESGLFIYHERTGEYVNLRKQRGNPWALSDNAVYTLCKDKEQGIWVGTYFGGINYYASHNTFFEKFAPMTSENAISGNAVRELCADGYGNLWVGTEDEGLNRLDTSTGRVTNYKPTGNVQDLSHTNVHGLLVTGDTLWVGTFEHGLNWLDIRTGKVIKHHGAENRDGALHNNFIFNIYQTRNRRILLASAKGLYEYDRKRQQFNLVREFPDHIFYTTIFEDSKGTLWVGTWRDGLYFLNSKTGEKGHFNYDVRNAKSIGSNRVNRVFEDSSGSIWVATEGGLCRWDTATNGFTRYGVRHGMPSNLILALLEDNKRNLWVTTSKGLVRFDTEKEEMRVFTQASGLLSDQFNYNSAYKAPDGTLYFGSVQGLIRFNPDNYIENTYEPSVYVTGFQVHHQELYINKNGSPLEVSITFTENLQLKHNQSSFSIDFAALSYISPGMTEYAYKMEGLDKEWTHIRTNRKAYFTELPPGDYTFRVNLADGNGAFKGKETELHITILPPWWASRLAYLVYVLFVAAAIGYGIRSYHVKVKERNRRKLEIIRHRKETELYHAKIDFFTNVAHEIRTPLTLIKAPLEKVLKKADELPTVKQYLRIMERNTGRLLELTDQLLDFRKTESKGYRLNFQEVNLNELLKENKRLFKLSAEQYDIRLKLTLPTSPCIAYIDAEALTKIISNLLSNGLKYAKHVVHMSLEERLIDDETFTITVRNDGHLIPIEMKEKIFETFYRLRVSGSQHGSGLGLALARSLAQLHNGSLYLADPQDELNVFVLILPIKPA